MKTADQTVQTSMTSLFGSMSSAIVNPLNLSGKKSVELVAPYKITISISRDGKAYPGIKTVGFGGFEITLDEAGYGEVEVK
jgi:hypothetical protein